MRSKVRECFNSSSLVNQLLFYYLDGQYYQVRIIHNPEELSLRGGTGRRDISIRLASGKIMRNFTVPWKHKYGIVIDEEAPDALVDHLKDVANLSYWDRWWNLAICNGTYVEYIEYDFDYLYQYTTTYTLDTWFNFTEDLHIE